MAFNIVEAISGDDDCAFDQPCRFGHRVESHAVYCHNDAWEDGPRKCRRTWYTGGDVRDEDCPGFEANPAFKGEMQQPREVLRPCATCKGAKLVSTDRGKQGTCPRCMGDGEEPGPIELSTYEQDTLESSHGIRGHGHQPFVRVASNKRERDSISKLADLDLIVIKSISPAGRCLAYMLENTAKGEAVMRQNWEARKRTPEAE